MSHSDFAHLGKQSHTPDSPDAIALDRIDNPSPDTSYLVRLSVPELTCLCPVTGQPDFAHLLVDYAPGAFLVESKSFKLYIASFRNHRTFHEACTIGIGQHLQDILQPEWIRVCGFWYPRGGIPIDVFWTQGACPDGVYIPDPGVASYRGRG